MDLTCYDAMAVCCFVVSFLRQEHELIQATYTRFDQLNGLLLKRLVSVCNKHLSAVTLLSLLCHDRKSSLLNAYVCLLSHACVCTQVPIILKKRLLRRGDSFGSTASKDSLLKSKSPQEYSVFVL